MSEKMMPLSFGKFMDWALNEYHDNGTIFGVGPVYKAEPGKALPMFGRSIETPFGPAAGPNTQLKQNIIAAYAAGARFFELKTVQKMDGDDLASCINRPCILAYDEGYNCEWSTELTVRQAFYEYVDAYFAINLLSREFGLGSNQGFAFNISVGYDLDGIKTTKIDRFIEDMKDASATSEWKECMEWAKNNLERFENVNEEYLASISPQICDSITLSTLHGCPPDEIERIAEYLITEKKLNTFVKCNPTLLGYEFARSTLDSLGFDYLVFDDFHFLDDLQYVEAVPMFKRLIIKAESLGLAFGVKLTNTFPVKPSAAELPADEMYMSGRSIFPLTAELARRLTQEFEGKLRISYSGGADAVSIGELYDAGIWPVTMATTILKPGGYNRFRQMAGCFTQRTYEPFSGVSLDAITKIAVDARTGARYRKPPKPRPDKRIPGKAPLFDCYTARCRSGCPFGQDVPLYLRLYGSGEHERALEVITEKNPLPNITGTICSHRCMERCTRNFYDTPVDIRGVKLACAESAWESALKNIKKAPANGKKAAVVGGGPAGLASAYFLARTGYAVTVFEKAEKPGGAVRRVIPEFRISSAAIDRDIELIKAAGVEFVCGKPAPSVPELKELGFDITILCVGAAVPGRLEFEYGAPMNALEFLDKAKNAPETLDIGENVVIAGGGNTAMDAARAAVHVPGVKNVSIMYRRTKRYMPADIEELEAAVADGVKFIELRSIVGLCDGVLTCRILELGEPDSSGRRSPVDTGRTEDIPASAVIASVGEGVDGGFYTENGLMLDARGLPFTDPLTLESSIPGVYVAGDGLRGPRTVAEAIADALRIVSAVSDDSFDRFEAENAAAEREISVSRRGVICPTCSESERCLECESVCECCADVCPNRANIVLNIKGRKQILHLDALCNECGNCAVFCPYDSAPYRDKLTLFSSRAELIDSENQGFAFISHTHVAARYNGEVKEYPIGKKIMPPELEAVVTAVMKI